MGGILNTLGQLLILAALLAAAFFVFAKVGSNYRLHGRLSPSIAILQTGYFSIYALCSYVFLDTRLSHIAVRGAYLILAAAFILAGLLLCVFSMPFLGRRSFGMEVGSLRTSGLYRYSRNPQLIGGFLFIVGYALLWPSWTGALWASLWLVISKLMVRGEEDHLNSVFGDAYKDYCLRTPRYLGLPGKIRQEVGHVS